MCVEKSVFIAYRHTNQYHALAIYRALKERDYDVFIDWNIGSGSFESVILNQIDARAHFLIVLTPSALERCNEPGDWLRREIEYAIKQKRNIVPLMFDSFDFDAAQEQLTGKLVELRNYNGLPIPSALVYFEPAIELLIKDYLEKSPDVFLHPTSPEVRAEVQEQKAAAEAAPAPTEEQLTAERYFEGGNVRALQRDFAGAIADYTEAIRLNPKYAEVYNNRGVARHHGGDYAGATEDCTEAIRLDPQWAAAYTNRGLARHRRGDYAEAIADYDEAIRLDPQWAVAYNNRGLARVGRGNYVGAIADYAEAIRLNPRDAEAYYNRGLARYHQGDTAGAIADYTEAIRLNPQMMIAYNNRGVVRANLRNTAGAIADWTEAIRLDPQDAEVYSNRGQARYDQGDTAGAIADWTEAIRLNPQMAMVYNNRGAARYDQGDTAGAIVDWAEAIRLNPQEAAAHINRGGAYFALKQYDQALSDFKTANKLGPGLREALASLAITHHAMGHIQKARRLWRGLLRMDKRYRDIDWVQTELAEPLVEEARKLIAGL